MYQSVKNVFSSFTNTFEGRVHWMYVDVKGLVTTGVGNLIDPVSLAVVLPFQHAATGAGATQAEITAAWTDLKNNNVMLGKAGYQACASRNDLRLSDPAIDNLVSSKLASNEATFLRSFPNFESWPADAQLAGMSMCWALGPAFASQWPQLSAALNAQNWTAAAANCNISTAGNPGVAPRNTADVALFNNAAAVVRNGADPSMVYYPGTVPASSTGASGTATPGSTGAGTMGGTSSTQGTSKSSGGSQGSASPGAGSSGASNTGTGSTDSSGTDSTDSSGTDSTDSTDTDSTDSTDTGSTDSTGTDTTDTGGTDTTDTGSTDTGGTDTTDTGSTDTGGTDTTDTTDTGGTDSTDSTDAGSTDTGGTDSTDTGSTDTTDTGATDTSAADSTDASDTDSSDPGSADTNNTGSTDSSDSDLTSVGGTGS
jgi:GH24 family phage-related lysozyme (muramidase)